MGVFHDLNEVVAFLYILDCRCFGYPQMLHDYEFVLSPEFSEWQSDLLLFESSRNFYNACMFVLQNQFFLIVPSELIHASLSLHLLDSQTNSLCTFMHSLEPRVPLVKELLLLVNKNIIYCFVSDLQQHFINLPIIQIPLSF